VTNTKPVIGLLRLVISYTSTPILQTIASYSYAPIRAVPLSFRAIKDLAISHYTFGRKSRGRLWAVGHFASWHPKRRLSECNLDIRLFWGAKSL